MKIYTASDHTGIELKKYVQTRLVEEGHEVLDCGAKEFNPSDDYPDLIKEAARNVSGNEGSIGIILGGSGQGEEMVANKFKNVRCALFYGPAIPVAPVDIAGRTSSDPFEIIRLTRQHNHANMLSLATRFLTKEDALNAVEIFIKTPYSFEERHIRRIEKIREIENEQ